MRAILAAIAALCAGGCAPTPETSDATVEAQVTQTIDEGAFIDINGLPQWVTVRGKDRRNPVLLMLHGGPGFPMSQWAPLVGPWEEHFTIVQWDQPGGGATYAKSGAEAQGDLSVARYTRDGLAVAEWARTHLGVRTIVVMGTSWGTLLGLEMVHARPELFSAYVGTAQVSSGFGDPRTFEIVLDAARARGDAAAVAALERVGPPPHARFAEFLVRQQFANVPAPREAAQRAAMAPLFAPAPADARYTPHLPPHDFIAVFMAAQRAMFAELQTYDLRRSVGTRFGVPIFVFQGDSDVNTPASLARAYFDEIEAPQKDFVLLPGVGHDTTVFAPELLTLLNERVRPLAARTR